MKISFTKEGLASLEKLPKEIGDDIVRFLDEASKSTPENMIGSGKLKKYQYSNDGIFVFRFKDYRIFANLFAKKGEPPYIIVLDVLLRSEMK